MRTQVEVKSGQSEVASRWSDPPVEETERKDADRELHADSASKSARYPLEKIYRPKK